MKELSINPNTSNFGKISTLFLLIIIVIIHSFALLIRLAIFILPAVTAFLRLNYNEL